MRTLGSLLPVWIRSLQAEGLAVVVLVLLTLDGVLELLQNDCPSAKPVKIATRQTAKCVQITAVLQQLGEHGCRVLGGRLEQRVHGGSRFQDQRSPTLVVGAILRDHLDAGLLSAMMISVTDWQRW